jgi:hypothetical protein
MEWHASGERTRWVSGGWFICEVCQQRWPPHTQYVSVWRGKGLLLTVTWNGTTARELRYHWRACPDCTPQLDTAYALAVLEDVG